MVLSSDCVAPRNYRSAGIKCPEMIRVVLTDAVYDAIASTLPKGQRGWPTHRKQPKMTPAQIAEAQRMAREWKRLGAPEEPL
jgi:hypothetical protein